MKKTGVLTCLDACKVCAGVSCLGAWNGSLSLTIDLLLSKNCPKHQNRFACAASQRASLFKLF